MADRNLQGRHKVLVGKDKKVPLRGKTTSGNLLLLPSSLFMGPTGIDGKRLK